MTNKQSKIIICPSYNPLDESQGLSQCIFVFCWKFWKNNWENGTKLQPPWEDQHKPKGNQEIIHISWGLTFHVTTKLLGVIIRPLTPPTTPKVESNSLRTPRPGPFPNPRESVSAQSYHNLAERPKRIDVFCQWAIGLSQMSWSHP
jgi:hypothetical protein